MRDHNKLSKEVEYIYEIFLSYYQYYHITTYPEQYSWLQNSEISSLTQEKYNHIGKVMDFLVRPNLEQFVETNHTYILEGRYFNQTKNTSINSMIDYLSNIKQALSSLDNRFIIENEYNIDTIISAFQEVTFEGVYQSNFNTIIWVSGLSFISFVCCCIVKYMIVKLKFLSRDILKLYETVP